MNGAPTFIIGTGRCGSTMLSNFLREHPQIASLSEFFSLVTDFGGRIAESFPEGVVSAEEFWRIIASPYPKQTLMHKHKISMDEVLYQPGPTQRFSEAVPAILQTTLPHLTREHDQLFEELEGFVLSQPGAPIGEQYIRLFSWLTARFGKRLWVERSGGSLRIVRRLAQAFPEARFVHLVRDGRNCALSMSRHHGFRMALIAMALTEILGVDPFESADRRYEQDIPEEFFRFLPEHFDAQGFCDYRTPLPLCGHYWSGEIIAGLRELSNLPQERVCTLRYEDFLLDPKTSIRRLAAFLHPDFVDEPWIERVAASVRPARSIWRALPEEERSALDEACGPGFEALRGLYPDGP